MPESAELFDHIEQGDRGAEGSEGKKILVTAGPTREAIDPVRYITNHSTGKMAMPSQQAAVCEGLM